ncbi:hypothetical protein RB5036 [Rhodopirellula baltica SH 1]|uniref:Uncharacterized protein n=1 Tax=Rhodopirellula baltica (strain DSM 10527 / NCIMB 13988 / SH1) TaxID=243090 RepID=Q7UGT0_RHOBA|nr:hypothetical protein RB5036 [Rhodopirellula baltica SH 1]
MDSVWHILSECLVPELLRAILSAKVPPRRTTGSTRMVARPERSAPAAADAGPTDGF